MRERPFTGHGVWTHDTVNENVPSHFHFCNFCHLYTSHDKL